MEETEKELLFVQMALDDARDKGNDKYVVPALIKMGLLKEDSPLGMRSDIIPAVTVSSKAVCKSNIRLGQGLDSILPEQAHQGAK